MKVSKFNRYKFFEEMKINESEFLQYQFGIEPMGTAGGGGAFQFAQDPSSSYFNYQDSPFVDFYSRQSGLVANLTQVIKQSNLIYRNTNLFLEDIDSYDNFKILRMFENNNLKLDIFLSFTFNGTEYFGAFKNFNGLVKPKFESELFYETEYQYRFNSEYKLKLSNFLYKKIEKWFIPEKGFYKNLKKDNRIKDNMGKLYEIKEDQIIEVLGYNISSDNKPFIIIKIKNKTYHIENIDYYFFKWRFEKIK